MSRISRRSLLTTGAAAGVLAASGLGVSAGTPKAGGTLRAIVPGGKDSDTWDARTHDSLFMMAASHGAVFDCLTEIGADGGLRGELAESWTASADARVWTFDLRKGVQFHNGKAFEAEDVLETFALHIGYQSGSPAEPLLRDVAGIKAIGAHQVQFTLISPNADFPYLLSDYHLVIFPAGYIELAMQNGIGTGLYKVADFKPGKRLCAHRVKNHYKGARAGFFDELLLINETNPSARLNALLEGDVNVSGQICPVHASQISTHRGVSLQNLQGNQHYSFAVGGNLDGHQAEAVRRAVKCAMDRPEFVRRSLMGYGQIGMDTPIGPANPYFASSLTKPEYDPELAKSLLREVGVKHLSIGVSAQSKREFSATLENFTHQMAQVGLRVDTVDRQATASLHFVAGRVTEDWAMSAYLAPGGVWNRTGWRDNRVNKLLSVARSEMDAEKRRGLYGDLQSVVQKSGSLLVPAFANHLQAVADTIATPKTIGAQYALDNARFAERWWRA
ncbi:ABC transporter substrate-binding protein [Shimia sagamensis]|uniref:Peptide/nickel transport system substrate-binding protein n=1 Tax=Shimia sagamensis TaxID=1566352 RepID=A0ABY1NAT7_9RHOB|nr:ABC transporter substrate-binding protein [Shimia sagamensis]SMP05123.1 peptide/nickel transport system substrate-binding protein [Shimia sagamensis]